MDIKTWLRSPAEGSIIVDRGMFVNVYLNSVAVSQLSWFISYGLDLVIEEQRNSAEVRHQASGTSLPAIRARQRGGEEFRRKNRLVEGESPALRPGPF